MKKIITLGFLCLVSGAVHAMGILVPLTIQNFHAAARQNKVMLLKKFLETGFEIDKKNAEGETALSYACGSGCLEGAKFLIDQGANINNRTQEGYTPLIWACQNNHKDIVSLLLSQENIDVQAQEERGMTALHTVSSPAIAELLINYDKTLLRIKDNIECSPLHVAAECGRDKVIPILIQRGVSKNCLNSDGRTALMRACEYNYPQVVNILLQHKVKVNLIGPIGETALYIACSFGRLELVKLLLKHSANPNLRNREDGAGCLHVACENENIEIADCLIKAGAHVNDITFKQFTALMSASRKGNVKLVKLLLEHQANPRIKKFDGETALDFALRNNHQAVVALLDTAQGTSSTTKLNTNNRSLELPVKMNTPLDKLLRACESGNLARVKAALKKYTSSEKMEGSELPLLIAVQHGYDAIVSELLDQGIIKNIDVKLPMGGTALAWGAGHGHHSTVELLLDRGADPTITDENGHSALDGAIDGGYASIVDLLLKRTKGTLSYKTASLYRACQAGHKKALECMMAHGVLTLKKESEASIIMAACQGNHLSLVKYLHTKDAQKDPCYLIFSSATGKLDIVNYLLELGYSPDAIDNDSPHSCYHTTALMGACQNGHFEIAQLLLTHKADPNTRDSRGYTPLINASRNGHHDIVGLLIHHKADLNAQDDWGKTALDHAQENNHAENIAYLTKALNGKLNACAQCEGTYKVQACAGCEKVYYCNRSCQKKDWKTHKVLCKKSSGNSASR